MKFNFLKRDMEIYKRRNQGEIFRIIAKDYQITPARVREIYLRMVRRQKNKWFMKGIPTRVINALAAVGLNPETAKGLTWQKLINIKNIGKASATIIKYE